MGTARHMLAAGVLGAMFATPAASACRLALALGVDISGSVDPREFALQRDGLAWALTEPEVVAAFLAVPGSPVRLMVFEWAGSGLQVEIVGWTAIDGPGALAGVAGRLRDVPRPAGPAGTATGSAMLYGSGRLAEQGDCAEAKLDLSTDGVANTGPAPAAVRRDPALAGVTVNALAIGGARPDGSVTNSTGLARLLAFLAREVISGPGAFVEETETFEGFAGAMKRKLLRELGPAIVGGASGPGQSPRYPDPGDRS